MPSSGTRDFTKAEGISVVIGILGFVTCFGTLMLLHSFAVKGPLTPDVVHGLVTPYNNHGVIHYVTPELSAWITTVFFAGFFSFFFVFIPTAKRHWFS